jgi:hypothetical protein
MLLEDEFSNQRRGVEHKINMDVPNNEVLLAKDG